MFRAARSKLHRLKQQRQVAVVDGVVTVSQLKKPSGVERCVDMLNKTGRCDTSAIWSNKRSAQNMIARMKRLGWVSPDDVWPVVSFVGRQPASADEFNAHKQAARVSE